MFVHLFVCPPWGLPARPDAQLARPKAQPARHGALPARPEAHLARSKAEPARPEAQAWMAYMMIGGLVWLFYGLKGLRAPMGSPMVPNG